jgi:adhesin transport system outer membrane protein
MRALALRFARRPLPRLRQALKGAGSSLVLIGLSAFPVSALSLQEALQISSNRDATIAAMRQKVARRTTDIQSARDALKPSLQFSADTTSSTSSDPALALTLQQVLFDWGYTRSKIESASQARVKSVTDLKSSVEELALNISKIFIQVAVDDLKLSKTRDYLTFASRIEKVSQRRVAGGVADSSEIARARLEVARAEDQIAQLNADRQTALAQLEFYIGHTATDLDSPPELHVTKRYKSSSKIITAILEAPEYVSAKADVAIARANVAKAKAARKPKIILKAVGIQELNGGRSRSASIGLTTSLDFDAGYLSGRATKAAEQDLAAAQSQQLAIERKLQNQLRTSVQQVQSLATTEAAQAKQLDQAERVRKSYEQQFIGGKRQLVEVLTSARDFYDAEMDKLDTYSEMLQTEYEAGQSVGMLGSLIIATNDR